MSGWFRVEHDTVERIAASYPPRQRAYALALYTVLAKLANEHRGVTWFEASNKDVAAMAGMSKDTLERIVPWLVALGLVTRRERKRGATTCWRVAATSGHSGGEVAATSGQGSRYERPQRARDLSMKKEEEERITLPLCTECERERVWEPDADLCWTCFRAEDERLEAAARAQGFASFGDQQRALRSHEEV